jgi:hypothetical protein
VPDADSQASVRFSENVGWFVMSGEGLVVILMVGLIARWLAELIMSGIGLGMVGALVVGFAPRPHVLQPILLSNSIQPPLRSRS